MKAQKGRRARPEKTQEILGTLKGYRVGEEKIIRIGGASGFWGDSSVAAPQLVLGASIDYLVFDYLAELTMAILASSRRKKTEMAMLPTSST
jgi:Acyclic terpene utilisation family protein AtuA